MREIVAFMLLLLAIGTPLTMIGVPQAGASAAQPPYVVFSEAPNPMANAPAAAGPDLAVIRSRSVGINAAQLAMRQAGELLELNFFDDASLVAVIDSARQTGLNTFHFEGRVAGSAHASFLMVIHNGAVAGIIRAPGIGEFRIRSSQGRGQVVEEIDPAKFLPCGTGPAQAIRAAAMNKNADAEPGIDAGVAGCTIIDVMIVYTPEARILEGGSGPVQAIALLAVDETNFAFVNSEIDCRVRLVYTGEVDYEESGSFFTEIQRLQDPSDGFMDEVHAIRNEYGADAVDLLVSHTQGGTICGIGYLMQSVGPGFEQWAFSVCNTGCASGGYTFAHELGHNMGCHHDRDNTGGSQGAFNFSYGHRFVGDDDVLYRTVMSYAPGNRIPYFSNPRILYQGQPTGLPEGHTDPKGVPDSADNARTINQTAETFANFRAVPPGGSGPQDPHIWTVPAVLQPDELVAGDYFGASVAIDGELAIIGAYRTDSTSGPILPDVGAAYIYQFEPLTQTWVQQAKLTPVDGLANDRFGVSVAIQKYGNGQALAVVGAYQVHFTGRFSGAAYVFRGNQGQWTQEGPRIRGNDIQGGDIFGWSVAVAASPVGDIVLVGAPNHDQGGSNSGAAYVFQFDQGKWAQKAKLRASDALAGDQFGHSLALRIVVVNEQDFHYHALIGAINGDGVINNSGSAYLFRWVGISNFEWEQVTELIAPDGASNDQFGISVGLDLVDQRLVAIIGAWGYDGPASNAGAAYVFREQAPISAGPAQNWMHEVTLLSTSPDQADRFGSSVAIKGNVAMVGSYLDDSATVADIGAAYVFRHHTGDWVAESRITAPGAAASEQFGYRLALTEYVAPDGSVTENQVQIRGAIGAWQRPVDEKTTLAGAVYFTDGLPSEDCNQNDISDICDILFGTSQDANGNGIPDECEIQPCDADITGDGFVNVNDLLAIINGWGTCPPQPEPCPADIAPPGPPTGDGVVNVNDLLLVINGWGPCQ